MWLELILQLVAFSASSTSEGPETYDPCAVYTANLLCSSIQNHLSAVNAEESAIRNVCLGAYAYE